MSFVTFSLFAQNTIDPKSSEDWSHKIQLINQEKINTEHTEFSPAYWNDLIVFVASRPRNKVFDNKINEAYFDLYFAAGEQEDALSKTALFSRNINTNSHEGPLSFSKDNQQVFYTSTQLDEDNIVRNKIFQSQEKNGEWLEGELSAFNFEKSASCHPTIGFSDGMIVFASDREGGYGKMDLYYSIFENDKWGKVVNLGPNINSEHNEIFPFLSDRGFLFYSSDKEQKSSGLDIYICEIEEHVFQNAKKLPPPINSQYDDFGLISNAKGNAGYLSTNRPGGEGKDDIYYYKSSSSLFSYDNTTFNLLSASITDNSGQVINNCTIKYRALSEEESKAIGPSVFSFENKNFESANVSKDGNALIQLDENYTLIEVSAVGKKNWYKILSGSESHEALKIILEDVPIITPKVQAAPSEKPVAKINNVELNVGTVLIFNNIYYDYNSHDIKAGAAQELDQLVNVMRTNKKLKIQLSAHTDSRGKNSYNQQLSEKRAIAAKNYLVQRGITSHNILTVGFGESRLRNHCKDGVKCSEAEHVYNRRTEVTVLEK